jgi:hypothetical protein
MPASEAGLKPTFPVITDALAASVMPGVPASMANGNAVPRFTIAGPAYATEGTMAAPARPNISATANTYTKTLLNFFIDLPFL